MLESNEIMKNFKNIKTQVTVGDRIILTNAKGVNWHGYQRRDGKLHCMVLSKKVVIPGLHANLFSVT